MKKKVLITLVVVIVFCLVVVIVFWLRWYRSDGRIISLLQSEGTSSKVVGAYLAGEKGDKKFVPYLLRNMNDPAMSTHIRFKGFSVYYEKVGALKKIYKIAPPKLVKPSDMPDSVVIKFYEDIYKKDRQLSPRI